MSKKDPQARLDDTLDYIQNTVGIKDVRMAKIRKDLGNDPNASNKISLGGINIMDNEPEKQRRRALRAFLLCVYWTNPNNLEDAKNKYRLSSAKELKDLILNYFPLHTNIMRDVLNAGVKSAFKESRICKQYEYTRALAENQIWNDNCYSAVATWLYMGGIVSLKWLFDFGDQTPESKFQRKCFNWEAREILTPEEADKIPLGRICLIYRGVAGVHFVLTVGVGNCVGYHNSVDVCKNWDTKRYGPSPNPTFSQFRIAGYLESIQRLYGSFIPTAVPVAKMAIRTAVGEKPYILTASILPKPEYSY